MILALLESAEVDYSALADIVYDTTTGEAE